MLVNTCDKKSEFVNYHLQFAPIYILLPVNFSSFDRKKERKKLSKYHSSKISCRFTKAQESSLLWWQLQRVRWQDEITFYNIIRYNKV